MQSRASFGHSCTLTGWVLTENTTLRSFWERKMPLFVFGKGEGAVFRLRLPSFHVALPVKTQVWLVAFPPSSRVLCHVCGRGRYCGLPAVESHESDRCRDFGYSLSHRFSAEEPAPRNENLGVRVPSRSPAVLQSGFLLINYFNYTHSMFSPRNVRNTRNYVLKIGLTSLDSR